VHQNKIKGNKNILYDIKNSTIFSNTIKKKEEEVEEENRC